MHSLFGHRGKGAVEPPPYMVQIEINQKNPVRIEAMNEMYMQAYTMAAQAQQFFPLSSLFEMLNIDGKDRLLPVIRQNEQWISLLFGRSAAKTRTGEYMKNTPRFQGVPFCC